jgi:hypothetical protein
VPISAQQVLNLLIVVSDCAHGFPNSKKSIVIARSIAMKQSLKKDCHTLRARALKDEVVPLGCNDYRYFLVVI